MSTVAPDYSYIGAGVVRMREYGSGNGFVDVGNVSALSFAVTTDTKKMVDHTRPGGGTRNQVDRISSVALNATFTDVSPDNMARAYYGETITEAATTVTAEQVAAFPGTLVMLAHLQPSAVVVKGVSGGTPPTYVEGVDYDVSDAGLMIYTAAEGGSIPAPTVTAGVAAPNISVAYSTVAADIVEAITNSGKIWEIVFAGLNEALNNKATTVHAFRVKFGPAQSLPLIGDDYATLDLTGEVLADTTKTGAGVSRYFRTKFAR